MTKTRLLKVMLIEIITIISILFIVFGSEISSTAIAGFYILSVGAFLQTDLKKMIEETKLLPPGKFEHFKLWKYLLCSLSFIILTLLSIAFQYESTASVFGGGLFIVIGSILAGLNKNKEVTGKKEEDNE